MKHSKHSVADQFGDVETGPESGRKVVTPASPTRRLVPVSTKVASTLSDEIDEYAKTRGITRSRAAGQYLAIASETVRGGDGVAASKAEEILEALEGVRTVVELLGPPAFGVMRLLSHWATQTGGLKVGEDELLAELRTVAADEWEQVVTEAERELYDAMRKARSEGGK
jgi:hypothetical protein